MEKRTVTCVVCPIGCEVEVTMENGKVIEFTGNQCKRGESYIKEECTNPQRMVSSTVRMIGGTFPVTAVRTDCPIPREKVFACMKEISALVVETPVQVGQVILKNVAGTDANICITRGDSGL